MTDMLTLLLIATILIMTPIAVHWFRHENAQFREFNERKSLSRKWRNE